MLSGNQNVNVTVILAIAALVSASAVIHASFYSLNFMIFPDLAPELDISGTAYGILAGIGLTIAFVLYLLPITTYVDTWDKRTLIIGGLLLKMFFGALQSVAWDFWSLLLIRLGLAVGFATSYVPCLSIIAQLDSGSEFGLGLSYTVLSAAPYLGVGLASWAGILSYLYGWQTTFGLYGFMCGLEAFVVILLIPQDKHSERMWAAEEGLLTVWLSKTVPLLLTIAVTLRSFAWLATVAYLPIYFQRFVVADDAAVPAISLWLGGAIAMAGCGGVVLGSFATGLLLDRAQMAAAPAFVAAAGCFLALPPLLLALFAPVETWLVLLLLCLSLLLGEVWIGPSTFMTQVCLPEHLRAAGATIFLVLCAILGSCILPVVLLPRLPTSPSRSRHPPQRLCRPNPTARPHHPSRPTRASGLQPPRAFASRAGQGRLRPNSSPPPPRPSPASPGLLHIALLAPISIPARPQVGLLLDFGLPLRPVLAAVLVGSHAVAGVAFVLIGLLSPNGFQHYRDEDAGGPDDDIYEPHDDMHVRPPQQGYQQVAGRTSGASQVMV